MTRPLLALGLVLATAATGCGDHDDGPPGAVTVYWGFIRNTAAGPVLYDAQDPGGLVEGACDESGVEYVRVTTLDGFDVDPGTISPVPGVPPGAISCVVAGVHGVTFNFIPPGTHSWNVTGFRTFDGREIVVAQSPVTFSVAPDRLSTVTVDVQPVQDDVQIAGVPWDPTNTAELACAQAGIAETDVLVWTYIGDLVTQQTIAGCGPLRLRLDRDDYTVRFRGFPSAVAQQPTHDTEARPQCEYVTIPQLGPVAGVDWLVDMWNVVGDVPCPL